MNVRGTHAAYKQRSCASLTTLTGAQHNEKNENQHTPALSTLAKKSQT